MVPQRTKNIHTVYKFCIETLKSDEKHQIKHHIHIGKYDRKRHLQEIGQIEFHINMHKYSHKKAA